MPQDIQIRPADAGDAAAVAGLHADSWRRHYRGAYTDHYLDGDLDADRLTVWSGRLAEPDGGFTLLAEDGPRPVGFVHVRVDADPTWGALVDNLHVVHGLQRTGVGTRLLGAAAQVLVDRRWEGGVYLWVLEPNTRAQAFYRARGGTLGDRQPVAPPGGDPANLDGTVWKLRVAWPGPAALLPRR